MEWEKKMKSRKEKKKGGEIITRRQHGRVLYHQANRRSAISSCVKHDRKSRDISSGKSFENGAGLCEPLRPPRVDIERRRRKTQDRAGSKLIRQRSASVSVPWIGVIGWHASTGALNSASHKRTMYRCSLLIFCRYWSRYCESHAAAHHGCDT